MMILCPAVCSRYFVVSEEDPDSSLSDVVDHLAGPVHSLSHAEAMRLLAQVELVAPPGGGS